MLIINNQCKNLINYKVQNCQMEDKFKLNR
jgi:hypothetical protein